VPGIPAGNFLGKFFRNFSGPEIFSKFSRNYFFPVELFPEKSRPVREKFFTKFSGNFCPDFSGLFHVKIFPEDF
jgi:hypothetical protein